MKKPDTNTIKGKTEVMLAFEGGKRIQRILRQLQSAFNDWTDEPSPDWDWSRREYRIHPDDLIEKKWRPWTLEEVPIGKIAVRKEDQAVGVIGFKYFAGVFISNLDGKFTFEDLLEQWTLEDGSPCGVEEEV